MGARSRPYSGLVICLLLAALAPLAPSSSAASAIPDVPRLSDLNLDAVAAQVVEEVQEAVKPNSPLRPDVEGIRVALLSSGSDTSILPEPLRERVSGATNDPQGIGSWMTSVLMQVADVQVQSFNVFTKDHADINKVSNALNQVKKSKNPFDVVLMGFPPHDLLDPVSASMDAGKWSDVLEGMSESATRGSFGIPADAGARNKALGDADANVKSASANFVAATAQWNNLRAAISATNLPVVVPAGDLGGKPGSVYGIAGLPEVITVGAGVPSGVAARSGEGPGLDGVVKPDLIAPAGWVGLTNSKSAMGTDLAERGLLDATLEPVWDAGDPLTDARARLDTTQSSAAVVAAIVGALTHEGVDTNNVRGALTAASTPIDGVPVWAQGAGLLRAAPTPAFINSRSIPLSHASLGAEPDSGTWDVLVKFTKGAGKADVNLTDFAGVTPDMGAVSRKATPAEAALASVGSSSEGVMVAAATGESAAEAGLICGYTDVAIPAAGVTLHPDLSAFEEVPVCLVKGFAARGFGFYIHDLPAEDLTFAMLPALPEELSVLEAPLMLLPVNPLHQKIYTAVTGTDGWATVPNFIPGYYRVLQFSDYGSPVTQTVASATTGAPITSSHDIGHTISYQGFDSLILPNTVTEDDLTTVFGGWTKDKPHDSYFVEAAGRTRRVSLGKWKKMPGPAVSSRVIDLFGYDDLEFAVAPLAQVSKLPGLKHIPVVNELSSWEFAAAGPTGETVEAVFNPLATQKVDTSIAGIAHYPFSLTTPNYTADLSLNFAYELTNAAVIVVATAGDEWQSVVLTPNGHVRTPVVGGSTPIGTDGVLLGASAGSVNLEFHLKPKGDNEGDLFFILLPSERIGQLTSPLASAQISDLSMAYETWQRTSWPASLHEHGQGHEFNVQPNYNTRQMSADGCRTITGNGETASVCEDWQVHFHSPGDDAATVDVQAPNGTILNPLVASGGRFADPNRGVINAGEIGDTLITVLDSAAGGLVSSNPFRVNGRFWEQLIVPKSALAANPGELLIQINDNELGRASAWATHIEGGAPVAGWVRFTTESVAIDPLSGQIPGVDAVVAVGKKLLGL